MTANTVARGEQGLTALEINRDVVVVLSLFIGSFSLYAATAAPGVLHGDFGEFQTNIYRLGVSHTGYPLYFLLAKLWTWLLPVGTIAYRANVFSGLFGALTLVLLYGMMRTLTERRLVALLVAVLFGVSRVQWSQSVIPDVYTLNSFFIVLVLWLAILWRTGRVPLWCVALAYGLSLTHHRTMILIAPAVLLFVLWGGGRSVFKPRALLATAAAFFLPLLLYAYIPLRGASDVGVEYHPGAAVNILSLNAFYDLRFGPPGFLWERFTQVYLALLIEQFTVVGFIFGLAGVAALALKRVPRGFPQALAPYQLLLLLGLAHLGETAFAICFWVFDSEIFFIPSYLTFLFFIGIGVAVALDELFGRIASRSLRRAVTALTAAAFVLWCAFLLRTNLPRVDQSANNHADARWQEILAQPLEENALLVGPWEDLTPLEYYQYVEQVRPDLKRRKVVLHQDQLPFAAQHDIERELKGEQLSGKQLYFTIHPSDTQTLQALDAEWDFAPLATLWHVSAPGQAQNWERAFSSEDALQSWGSSNPTLQAGDFLNVLLTWVPDAPLDSLRLVWSLRDRSGAVWRQQESLPLGARDPAPGENPIRDAQGIFIPPDAPPGNYTLTLNAIGRETNEPQAITNEGSTLTMDLNVHAPDAPTARPRISIPRPLEATAAGGKFLGYAVSAPEPRGGDIVEVASWWQEIERADDTLEIKLRDAGETETVLYHGALFPAADGPFNPAQIVRARQEITIPPTAAAGYARLLLSLNGEDLPPIRIALGASTRSFRPPEVQHPQFGGVGSSLQLLGYRLDGTRYRAGQTVPLRLYWHALSTPDSNYKVFVHLIDVNGVVRAQQDSFPRAGALPTDRWFPGEYIADDYSLALPADLAPGEYRLLVGMYDEASGVRASLQDANGTGIANNALELGNRILVE